MTSTQVTQTISQQKLASYRDKETTMLGNRFGEAIKAGLALCDPDDDEGLEELAQTLASEIAPYFESALRRAIAARLDG